MAVVTVLLVQALFSSLEIGTVIAAVDIILQQRRSAIVAKHLALDQNDLMMMMMMMMAI